MNIGSVLGQLINNTVSPGTGTESAQKSDNIPSGGNDADYNSGLKLLKDMLAGDTFSGRVVSVSDGNVLLKLNDGKSVLARLATDTQLQTGQNVTFLIEGNDGKNIAIRPMESMIQQSVLVSKALDAAGMPQTAANVSIVDELLRLGMSVDTETIAELVKNSQKFPTTDISTLANLIKLNMPVTQENIIQYEAYKSYEHSIAGELNKVTDSMAELFVGDNRLSDLQGTLFGKLIDTFYNDTYSAENISENAGKLLGKEGTEKLTVYIENLADEIGKQSDKSNENISRLTEGLKQGDISAQELLKGLSELVREFPELTHRLSQLSGTDEFKKLIGKMIDETLKLTPETIDKDGIKKYYNKVSDTVKKAIDTVSQSGIEAKSLTDNLNMLKNNIEFMNDLNKNMTYMQLPVKLNDGETNGELYVFTNKRALRANSEQVSALLHLDMDNLGPVDVYVKLSGVNVSTDFRLESDELLDFVCEHIDKLNERLRALGYNFSYEVKTLDKDSKPFNLVRDIIECDGTASSTTQYVLDVRA